MARVLASRSIGSSRRARLSTLSGVGQSRSLLGRGSRSWGAGGPLGGTGAAPALGGDHGVEQLAFLRGLG
jgi:hypothetical protein